MIKLCNGQVTKTLKSNEIKLKMGESWWYFLRYVIIYPVGDSGPYQCSVHHSTERYVYKLDICLMHVMRRCN